MRASEKPRVLIIHASEHGQTRRIAEAIGVTLRRRGCVVELADAHAGTAALPPPLDYDAVVLGSRVQLGAHARAIGAYVRAHRAELHDVVTAFFSVSMAAANPANGTDPNGYVRKELARLAWTPARTAAFAGELAYRRYGLVTRYVMKRIAGAAGHTTDTSRDHEFTDWDAVARFAQIIALDVYEACASRTDALSAHAIADVMPFE
jgi:menaquinone-dependent protoporphyrinogen oxidase